MADTRPDDMLTLDAADFFFCSRRAAVDCTIIESLIVVDSIWETYRRALNYQAYCLAQMIPASRA